MVGSIRHKNEPTACARVGKFLGHVFTCHLLMKDSTALSLLDNLFVN